MLFDVEHHQFWHPEWDTRPEGTAAALGITRQRLAEVPQLLPVMDHRYLPTGRGWPHRAVTSVHQSDVVHDGDDLLEWVEVEFFLSSDARDAYYRRPSTRPWRLSGLTSSGSRGWTTGTPSESLGSVPDMPIARWYDLRIDARNLEAIGPSMSMRWA